MPSAFLPCIPFWENRITEKIFCTGHFFSRSVEGEGFSRVAGRTCAGRRAGISADASWRERAFLRRIPAEGKTAFPSGGRNAPDAFAFFRAWAWQKRLSGRGAAAGDGHVSSFPRPDAPDAASLRAGNSARKKKCPSTGRGASTGGNRGPGGNRLFPGCPLTGSEPGISTEAEGYRKRLQACGERPEIRSAAGENTGGRKNTFFMRRRFPSARKRSPAAAPYDEFGAGLSA